MMRFDVLTLFPNMISSYASESILGRATTAGLISVTAHNIRDYSTSKHSTVDDIPYGGGAGMVMMVEPIDLALQGIGAAKGTERQRIILLSAKGPKLTQQKAQLLATDYDRLVFVCGRYEGVDERVVEHLIDEEISLGDFVLTGGELGALVVIDAVARLLPGVLGNEASFADESHSTVGVLEYPHYTRPAEYRGWSVPEVLQSGHHGAIATWRAQHRGTRFEPPSGD